MNTVNRRLVVAALGWSIAMTALPAAPAEPLRIVIYGGSGNIGQRIVTEALNRGHLVTVVSRDPSRVKAKHQRLSVVQGNVLQADGVARQIKGQQVVVSAIGADRANNPDYGIYKKAAESLVTALRTLGAQGPRLIVVGGAGSLEVSPGVLLISQIPERFRAEIQGQKDALDYYRTISDVKWTYFSPAGSIAPGQRTGKFRLGTDQLVTDAKGDSRISTEDYAVALIDEAEKPQHVGKRFTIGY
jgi:putative NADH-flavin reductase